MSQTNERFGGVIESHHRDGTAYAIHPMDLSPDEIDVWSCAHALSQLCRYGGQTKTLYSVAQHSVIVSHLVPPHLALVGLLHDLTEGLGLIDVPRLVKNHLPEYRVHEGRAWAVVAQKFNLPMVLSREVEYWDKALVATERRDLCGPQHAVRWPPQHEFLPLRLKAVGPRAARAMYMARYEELVRDPRAAIPSRARIAWNKARYALGLRTMTSGAELAGVWP